MKLVKENKYFLFDRPQVYNIKFYVKYAQLLLMTPVYRIALRICRKPIIERKYDLVICAIFKDEAPFLKEWIVYHQLIGFKHFYLYNNNSTDNYSEVLQPFIDEGVVTLIDWPQIPGQLSSYTHWYENFRYECNWVSFLDCDEFFCPREASSMQEWIKQYKNYPVILFYWQFFGTSGNLKHDQNKLVIEQYHNCYAKRINMGKVLYNTNYDIASLNMMMHHYLVVRIHGINIPPVNCFKKFVNYDIHRVSGKGKFNIQINHYWSRAYYSYVDKQKKGEAAFVTSYKTFEKFVKNERLNISTDSQVNRFVVETKLKMRDEYPSDKTL